MFLSIFIYLLATFTANSIQSTMDRSSHFVAQAATYVAMPVTHIDSTSSSTTIPEVLPTATAAPTIAPTSVPVLTVALPTAVAQLVPTAVPTSPPVASAPSDYESLFDQYSSQYGVDKEVMKKIARCESGINPASRNGIYGGMFQFAGSTWISTRNQMGLDPNIDLRFSAADAIAAAAFKISHGGIGAWSGCL